MTRHGVALALALATVTCARAAYAQDAGAADGGVAAVSASAERSTVDALASTLVAQVTQALAEPAAPALRGDLRVETCVVLAAAPRADALAAALTGPTLTALRADARFQSVDAVAIDASDAADESDAPARAAARRGYEALLRIVLETRGNHLVVRGALWRTSRGGWRALFRAAPARIGSPFVRARLDAELRLYVGALPQVTEDTVVARALALPGRGYVALAAADLDGDGRSELVLARAESVEVLRLAASARGRLQLETVASQPFPATLPRASSRPRRTIATATADGNGVVLRTSELAAPTRAQLVDGRLVLSESIAPCGQNLYPLGDACALAVPGHDHFAARLGALGASTPRDQAQRRSGPLTLAGFYARVARKLRRADGSVLDVEAVVTPAGRLAVRVGARPGGAVAYGTALALADLEDDGIAELLASGPGLSGEGDRLALLRVRESAQVLAVWQSEMLAGDIWIAASADLDDDGLEELLAVEEPAPGSTEPARLWIVR